jgi:hypothetical protein
MSYLIPNGHAKVVQVDQSTGCSGPEVRRVHGRPASYLSLYVLDPGRQDCSPCAKGERSYRSGAGSLQGLTSLQSVFPGVQGKMGRWLMLMIEAGLELKDVGGRCHDR